MDSSNPVVGGGAPAPRRPENDEQGDSPPQIVPAFRWQGSTWSRACWQGVACHQPDDAQEVGHRCGPCGASVRGTIGLLIFGVWVVEYWMRQGDWYIAQRFPWSVDDDAPDSVVDRYDNLKIAFSAGHSSGYILGGVLTAQFDGALVAGRAVLISSLLSFLAALGPTLSFPSLLICYMLTGLGLGVGLSAIIQYAAQWVPPSERSRFVAISATGQILADLFVLLPAAVYSWTTGDDTFNGQWYFILSGTTGLAWSMLWYKYVASSSTKRRHAVISAGERRYIEHNLHTRRVVESTAGPTAEVVPPLPSDAVSAALNDSATSNNDERVSCCSLPWRRLLTEPACLAIYGVHATGNLCASIRIIPYGTMYPSDMVYTVRVQVSMSFLGCIAGAFFADWLLNTKGLPLRLVRKCTQTIASSAGIISVGYMSAQLEPTVNATMLTAGLMGFFGAFSFSGYFANMLDIGGPRCVGLIFGISSAFAAWLNLLGMYLVSSAMNQGDMEAQVALALSAVVQALSLALYIWCAKGEPVFARAIDR